MNITKFNSLRRCSKKLYPSALMLAVAVPLLGTAPAAWAGEVSTSHEIGLKTAAGSGTGTYDLCAYSRASGSTNETRTDTAGGTPGTCNPADIFVDMGMWRGKPKYGPSVGVRGVAKPTVLPFTRTIKSETESEGAKATGTADISIPATGAPTLTVNATATATGDTQIREAAAEAKDPMFVDVGLYGNYTPTLTDLFIDVDSPREAGGIVVEARGSTPGSEEQFIIWSLVLTFAGLPGSINDLAVDFIRSPIFLPDVVVSDVIAAVRGAITFDQSLHTFSLSGPLTLFNTTLVVDQAINYEEALVGAINAVPEPAAFSLLGLGALSLAGLRRRRRG